MIHHCLIYVRRRAFTLIELAMVLAVSGLMVGFVLKTNQSQSYSDSECTNITRGQLIYIQGAIERFARSNDRLPLPARRFVGADSATYGREAVAGDLTVAGGVTFGALPWQALQLPASFAGDCWGNKYTYMVTTALTTNASSGGYLDAAVVGNIARKTSSTVTADAQIAYAVISHGPDKLGAVKLNYDDSGGAMDRKWCTGSTDIAYTNCLATAAIVMDAPINDGKDAGTAYFDDIVAAAGKPKILASPATGYYAFGWGENSYAQIGDGYKGAETTPQLVYGGLTFTSVSTGGNHTCGLTAAGTAYCWGQNTSGQLGIGSTATLQYEPVAVAGGHTFSTIAAGSSYTCGITTAGAAYCWGLNDNGQLGIGSVVTPQTSPVAVTGGLTFRLLPNSITAGFSHTCGLTAAGAAYCWGRNVAGQTGIGSVVTPQTSPVAVTGGLTFDSLAAGYAHTCGLTAAGAAYCWGTNGFGQIGIGSVVTPQTSPVAVTGGLTFSKLIVGDYHTCGRTVAGAAYCWGYNPQGQTGIGSVVTPQTSPVAVAGGLTFSDLTAGSSHTCGLNAAGAAYCWGNNGQGQMGIGSTVTPQTSPMAVAGGLTFSNIFAGANHTCGRTVAGGTYCWGYNGYGQVGIRNGFASLVPKAMKGGLIFTSAAAGGTHNCGLTAAGAAYCWGRNDTGQVGIGSVVNPQTLPVAVTGGLTFTSIAAGGTHTCGLTAAGAAYCWGVNTNGQIGIGSVVTPQTSPVAVTGGLTFTSIAAGYFHTCGLTAAGAAYCWGQNTYGQIGIGSVVTPQTSPVAVTGGLTFTSIAAGAYHTCGLTAAGAAYCWGRNDNGQTGIGSVVTPQTSPVAVTGGLAFSNIYPGFYFTCGLTTAGAAYCWGNNSGGHLGIGNAVTPQLSPVAVTGGLTFIGLSSNGMLTNSHTCGFTAAGAAYCWGNNNYGQIGIGSVVNPQTSPVLVTNSGTANFTVKKIVGGYSYSFALAELTGGCTLPGALGQIPDTGFETLYQSATPTGACVPEHRVCTNGTLSGSYTSATCAPGCDARTEIWNGVASGCTAAVPALAGGGSTVITDAIAGPSGSATANCSATGVLTLSGTTCVP